MGTVRALADYWHHGKLNAETESSTVDIHKKLDLAMSCSAIRSLLLPSLPRIFSAAHAHWLNALVSRSLTDNLDCYVAELLDRLKFIHRFGSNGPLFSLSPAVIDYLTQYPLSYYVVSLYHVPVPSKLSS